MLLVLNVEEEYKWKVNFIYYKEEQSQWHEEKQDKESICGMGRQWVSSYLDEEQENFALIGWHHSDNEENEVSVF